MSIAALFLALGINMSIPALSAVAIVAFVMAFSLGLGPVVWIVISDVMPKEAATAAGAVGVGINWAMAFIMVGRLRRSRSLDIAPTPVSLDTVILSH